MESSSVSRKCTNIHGYYYYKLLFLFFLVDKTRFFFKINTSKDTSTRFKNTNDPELLKYIRKKKKIYIIIIEPRDWLGERGNFYFNYFNLIREIAFLSL